MILRKCAATHTRLGHMNKNRIACDGEEHILHPFARDSFIQ